MERLERIYQQLRNNNIPAIFINNISNIRYLTNYQGDDAFLLVLATNEAYLITDGRYIEQAEKDCHNSPGLKLIQHAASKMPLDKVISDITEKNSLEFLAFEKESLSYNLYSKLKANYIKLNETSGLVERFRRIKDQKEQELLSQATAIADRAFNATIPYIKPGITEKELAARFTFNLLDQGADALSFPLIVASGKNGSLPHALPSDKQLKKGDFITFDFGAVYRGYHSDTTRTVVIGHPSSQQKEVYSLVKKAQGSAAALLRPGVAAKDAHFHAAEIIKEGGYDGYFTHGLGHGTGLDIHEAPTLNPASEDILEAGNTVTSEPGIYIPGWGGVRIEDTLIITNDGSKPLGSITKELIIV